MPAASQHISVLCCFAAGIGCQLSTSGVASVGASQKSDARMPAFDASTDIANITKNLIIVKTSLRPHKAHILCNTSSPFFQVLLSN